MSTITNCDICGHLIKPSVSDTSWGTHLKRASKSTVVVTPRKNRLYIRRPGEPESLAMIRVNIDIYVSQSRDDDVHVHHDCLLRAVAQHMADNIEPNGEED